ncbi:MAG: ABC transporter permease [Actinomycetota bacterium]
MSLRRSAAVIVMELKIMTRPPGSMIVLVVMPLLMMAFFKPMFRASLVAEGYEGASGAEQAVPGLSVLFALFLVSTVGYSFFQEHGWGTWQRLLASPASPTEIMVGKVIPTAVIAIVQQVILFAAATLLMDLHIKGSLLALGALVISLTVCLVALGILCAAIFRTVQQLNTVGNLGAILIGGLGGGLAPVALLPGWAQTVAPAVPSYWAIKGYRQVVLEPAGIADVMVPILVLLGIAVVVTPIALRRFRFDEVKTGTWF